MAENDFDTVTTIAADRPDISIFMSSTPTGRRGKFYEACTNKKMGFNEHHYPSTCNPNWCTQMEEDFRAQLSEQGYVHEILAEFGTQDTGVFDKDKLDESMQEEYYYYSPLTGIQELKVKESEFKPTNYIYEKRAPINPFRTMGVNNLLHYKVICS